MCRLYGFHSNEPTKVECTLVHSQNSLLIQSRSDALGRQHADGWGIAYYHGEKPILEKNPLAAFSGLHFSDSAERVYAHSVVAHVRMATVGNPSIQNCHPFQWREWVFAHNGTVTGIETLRPQLLKEMGSELASAILGTTDSELLFHWLISKLQLSQYSGEDDRVWASVDDHNSDSDGVVDVWKLQQELAALIMEVDDRCRIVCPERPARLNVVLTNGRILLASCLRNTLYWVHRIGLHDCEICGIPHVAHHTGVRYEAVIVASEPLSHEFWQPVPDGSVLAVAADMTTQILTMQTTPHIITES